MQKDVQILLRQIAVIFQSLAKDEDTWIFPQCSSSVELSSFCQSPGILQTTNKLPPSFSIQQQNPRVPFYLTSLTAYSLNRVIAIPRAPCHLCGYLVAEQQSIVLHSGELPNREGH